MEKTNKLILALLVSLTCLGIIFPGQVSAERVSLEWRAPTQQCDGSALTTSGLRSYKIYFSLGSGRPNKAAQICFDSACRAFQYQFVSDVTDITATTAVIAVPQPGTYYITMTAVGVNGEESCYSNEVTKEVTSSTPNTPLNFEISLSDFN